MNTKMIRYVIGHILQLEGILMLVSLVLSFVYKESNTVKISYVITIGILEIFGFIFSHKTPEDTKIYAKDGMMMVAASWIVMSAMGALPFVISGNIPSYVDAYFEVVSGFTTTGASILKNVEILDKSMLFFRSFTHFVGGMGVLVLVLAILPKNNNQSIHIMKAEVPGPTFGKLVAKMSYNSRILYKIYIVMTVILVILLKFGGMSLYESVVHAFGVAGTGGFSVKNASIGYYNSKYIEVVIGIGMLMFGMNFNLFYALLLKNYKQFFKNEELKYYIIVVISAIVLIGVNIYPIYKVPGKALRDSFFTVSSIITTTGYGTADFDKWPVFSKTILLVLMFIGGCAGSTAGGIKVSRVIILFKTMVREIRKTMNPNRVLSIKIDDKPLKSELVEGVKSYFVVYSVIFICLTILVSLDTPDYLSSFSAVAATFNNIGPGMGIVGPTCNYSEFSNFNKIILSFSMLLGRLEIFPIIILFSPKTYKK